MLTTTPIGGADSGTGTNITIKKVSRAPHAETFRVDCEVGDLQFTVPATIQEIADPDRLTSVIRQHLRTALRASIPEMNSDDWLFFASDLVNGRAAQ